MVVWVAWGGVVSVVLIDSRILLWQFLLNPNSEQQKWALHLLHPASFLHCTLRCAASRSWKQHASWLVQAVRRSHLEALASQDSGFSEQDQEVTFAPTAIIPH